MTIRHGWVYMRGDGDISPGGLTTDIKLRAEETKPAKLDSAIAIVVELIDLVDVMFTGSTDTHIHVECAIRSLGNAHNSFTTRELVLTGPREDL